MSKRMNPVSRTIDVGGDFDGNSFEDFESNADEFARVGGSARDNRFSNVRHRPWHNERGEPRWWSYAVGAAAIVGAVAAVLALF
ncbi:MAG: hypothetical protein Q8K79_23470 [Solirubrobacteraceae bacterium]|nr:hypothetical protein [Solirubrobacteraceae bacterium]